jgi:hypothetical protein
MKEEFDAIWEMKEILERRQKDLQLILENPLLFLAKHLLISGRDQIQEDLGDVRLEDVEKVLIKFSLSTANDYLWLMKKAVFCGSEEVVDAFFKTFIEDRVKRELCSIIEAEYKEKIAEIERRLKDNREEVQINLNPPNPMFS